MESNLHKPNRIADYFITISSTRLETDINSDYLNKESPDSQASTKNICSIKLKPSIILKYPKATYENFKSYRNHPFWNKLPHVYIHIYIHLFIHIVIHIHIQHSIPYQYLNISILSILSIFHTIFHTIISYIYSILSKCIHLWIYGSMYL